MIPRPGEGGIGIPEPLSTGRLTGHRSVMVKVCVYCKQTKLGAVWSCVAQSLRGNRDLGSEDRIGNGIRHLIMGQEDSPSLYPRGCVYTLGSR